MNRVWAIAKRELADYFHSPVAYAVAVVFLILGGYFFYNFVSFYHLLSLQPAASRPPGEYLTIAEGVLRPLFENLAFLSMLIIPFLTMRLIAEEKRRRSHELLMTYPVSDAELIGGKFLASALFYVALLILSTAYPILLAGMTEVDPGPLLAGYLGLILTGASFLAIGLLVSCTTESPIAAAVGTFGALLLVWTIGWSTSVAGPRWTPLFESLSFLHRFGRFAEGIVDLGDVVFFVAATFALTVCSIMIISARKWRG